MKIYVGHSREFDFQNELYIPLRKSRLNAIHEIILPHEKSEEPFPSKEILKRCNVMIAEVSHPSTGLDIEIGWANSFGVKIICIFKKGCAPSKSLVAITDKFVEYSNEREMIEGIEEQLKKL